jgi:hypothetical protein
MPTRNSSSWGNSLSRPSDVASAGTELQAQNIRGAFFMTCEDLCFKARRESLQNNTQGAKGGQLTPHYETCRYWHGSEQAPWSASCGYVHLYPLVLLVTHFHITNTSQPYTVIGHHLALSAPPSNTPLRSVLGRKAWGMCVECSAWKAKGGEFLFLARDCGNRMVPRSLALVSSPIRRLPLSKRRLGCRTPASFAAIVHL